MIIRVVKSTVEGSAITSKLVKSACDSPVSYMW